MFLRQTPKTSPIRWVAGVSITGTCRRIESALIGIHGQGSGAPVEIRKTIAFDIPREIIDSYNELQNSVHSAQSIPAALYQHVRKELVCIEEEALNELIAEARLSVNDVFAAGVHDAGLRIAVAKGAASGGIFYHSLCDAPRLAAQTGLNIVDSFPENDIAARGTGTPLFPLPAWIFLKSETADRLLIDLGRTARLTFLPKAETGFSHQKIQHTDIVPCGSLLDTLVWQLTGGQTALDIGGRFAVQGCQIPQLLQVLRAVNPPKESGIPAGLKPERYLAVADKAAQAGASHQDILCTVSTFIAERIAEAVVQVTKDRGSEPELLIQGSGRQHGLLLNSLAAHLNRRAMQPIYQLGFPADAFDALCTAMLTVLLLDGIPGSLPHLTGSETVQTLGRLTAGSPANWHRLLEEMANAKPVLRSLRSAG